VSRRAPSSRGAAADRKINLNASAAPSRKPTFKSGPPLKPRRKLFVGLLVGFVGWVAVLLTLYFTTIYPRHVPGDIRPPEAVGSDAS
jgi:hypothetical protein